MFIKLAGKYEILNRQNLNLIRQLRAVAAPTTTLLQIRNSPHCCLNVKYLSTSKVGNFFQRFFAKMDDSPAGVFSGQIDRFNGVTVDSAKEYDQNVDFEKKLKKSIDCWEEQKRRAIWFKVRTTHTDWVPHLTKQNFEFHHARTGYVILRRWLPKDEYANLPDYAHTMVGVGGLVINLEKMEVLVVTDRFAMIPGSWKLPGGYVDPTENLVEAAIREVKEETGVDGIFRTMVNVRHSHGGNFGCSDLYFVIGMLAASLELKPCEREIARVQWMPIKEYLKHPNVHETNRHTMRTYLDYEKRGVRLDCLTATHQILKKEYQLFYTRALEEHEKINVPLELESAESDACKKK